MILIFPLRSVQGKTLISFKRYGRYFLSIYYGVMLLHEGHITYCCRPPSVHMSLCLSMLFRSISPKLGKVIRTSDSAGNTLRCTCNWLHHLLAERSRFTFRCLNHFISFFSLFYICFHTAGRAINRHSIWPVKNLSAGKCWFDWSFACLKSYS